MDSSTPAAGPAVESGTAGTASAGGPSRSLSRFAPSLAASVTPQQPGESWDKAAQRVLAAVLQMRCAAPFNDPVPDDVEGYHDVRAGLWWGGAVVGLTG